MESVDVNNIEIEHCGDVRTIGSMIADLKSGRASYWHWHTLLNDFTFLYCKIRNMNEYGILLSEFPVVNKTPYWEIEGHIAQGGYDKKTMFKLVDMYGFLLSESEQ